MTRLLASVTSVEEAELVLRAGADIVDLKDPALGALGALSLTRIRAIVETVDGRRPVSATVGDLPADPDLIARAVNDTAATGVDFVKVGLFEPEYFDQCLHALAYHAATGVRLVAVLFADRPPYPDVVARVADAGLKGVMLDTADKTGGGLRRHLSMTELSAFVAAARARGLLTGLAGSLRMADIGPLLAADADYLGFRTALCGGHARTDAVDPAAVAAIRACLPRTGHYETINIDMDSHDDRRIGRIDMA